VIKVLSFHLLCVTRNDLQGVLLSGGGYNSIEHSVDIDGYDALMRFSFIKKTNREITSSQ